MKNYKRIEAIKRVYIEPLSGPEPDWPMKVQRAVTCIHEHLFDPDLNVRWIKAECYINGHNFSGRFKFYLGTTPKSYINDHRVNVAKKILSQADHIILK